MKAALWLVALASCLVFANSSQAQHCHNRVYYASSPTYYYGGHHQAVKYYPGWTYNHHDGYYYKDKDYHHKDYYPVQKVVAQEVQVAPLIVTVPVASYGVPVEAYGPKHYYTVTEAYQQKAQIRDIIREELRAALSGATSGAAAPAPITAPVPPAPMPHAPAAVSGRGAGTPAAPQKWEPDTATPPDVQKAVIVVFKGHCGTCHTSGTSGGIKLIVTGPDGKEYTPKMTRDQKWAVYGALSTGYMPPEAAKDASKAVPNEKLPEVLRWTLSK